MRGLAAVAIVLHGLLYAKANHYTLDVLEVDWNTTTPDLVEIDFKVVQPTRGIYAVGGYFNFKEDINTDLTFAQVKIFYSSNGISYQLTPFRIPNQTLTNALNVGYKQYLMARVNECCKNAPKRQFFVTPLTKRLIMCEECIFPGDNFPSSMRPGYYRLVIMIYSKPELSISILLQLELE